MGVGGWGWAWWSRAGHGTVSGVRRASLQGREPGLGGLSPSGIRLRKVGEQVRRLSWTGVQVGRKGVMGYYINT